MCSFLEGAIKFDSANFTPKGGLCELGDSELIISYAIRGAFWVDDLVVQHSIDVHLHIVACDTDLFGNIESGFLERMAVTDSVNERGQNMKPWLKNSCVLTETLDDIGILLRDNDSGFAD